MHAKHRFSFAALAVAAVGLGLLTSSPLSAEPPSSEQLIGTWQLVSRRYGDAKEWENVPDSETKVKVINPTHFAWVSYESATGKVQSVAGGTFTLAGTTYTEVIEYGDEEMITVRGEKQEFQLDLKGDKLEQDGQLSNGFKIAEVWRRVH